MSEQDDSQEMQIEGVAEEAAPARWRGVRRAIGLGPQAQLITSAEQTLSQRRRRRENVYNFLQFLRIPLLVVGLIFWGILGWWLAGVLVITLSVPLPWIAVVIANEPRSKKDKRERQTYKPALARAQTHALEQHHQAQLESGIIVEDPHS